MGIFQEFSGYLRNIAVYMIFMSVVNVIMPEKKYKNFVNLVMGLVLMAIVISPIGGLLNGGSSLDGILGDAALRYQESLLKSGQENAGLSEKQKENILKEYESLLSQRITAAVEGDGKYAVQNISFDFEEGDDRYFGNIKALYIALEEKPKEPEKQPFLKIEQVKPVKPFQKEEASSPVEENNYILDLKNSISDFYNVPADNIYISVRMKNPS